MNTSIQEEKEARKSKVEKKKEKQSSKYKTTDQQPSIAVQKTNMKLTVDNQ